MKSSSKFQMVVVRCGLLKFRESGAKFAIVNPELPRYEGRRVRLHEDGSIWTEDGKTCLGLGRRATPAPRPTKAQMRRILASVRKSNFPLIIPRRSEAELIQCIKLLSAFTIDVLPQIGKLALQDYAGLNTGLALAEKILGPDFPKRRS
jgi:hypothetical protein